MEGSLRPWRETGNRPYPSRDEMDGLRRQIPTGAFVEKAVHGRDQQPGADDGGRYTVPASPVEASYGGPGKGMGDYGDAVVMTLLCREVGAARRQLAQTRPR